MADPQPPHKALRAVDCDGVVFDLDGVLVDSWQLYLEVYRNVFAELLGRSFDDRELIANARTTEKGTLGAVLSGELQAAGFDCFKRWYFRLFDELARPFPAAIEALAAAREKGKRVGIFTGKARETALYSLERLGVADAVECVASEDDYDRPKPHQDGLVKIIGLFHLPARRVLFIGDQESDLQAGRAAGVKTGAALWAPYTTIAVGGRRPDVVFATAESCREFMRGV